MKRLFNIICILILLATVVLWSVVFVAGLQSEDKLVAHLTLGIDPIILAILLTQEVLLYVSIKYFLFCKDKTWARSILYGILLAGLILLVIGQVLLVYPYFL